MRPSDIQLLASDILGTTVEPSDLYENMIGGKAPEDIRDKLADADVYQCQDCDTWTRGRDFSHAIDRCSACAASWFCVNA